MHNFAQKVRESLKYRFFYGYCNLLKQLKLRQLPQIDWKPLNSALPQFIVLTQVSDVPLLIYNLRSLMQHSQERPPLWLVADSEAALTVLKQDFPAYPSEVQFWFWQDLLATLEPAYQAVFQIWTTSGQWGGYAKKLAIALAANQQSDMLLFDADVLWFGNFIQRLQELRQTHATFWAGQDYAYAYDRAVIQALNDLALFNQPPLNSGLVYVPHQQLLKALPASKLTSLLNSIQQVTPHSEQTLIAHAFWQTGGQWFPEEILATTLIDNFKWNRQVSALVRHYAGGKHLFWRDV